MHPTALVEDLPLAVWLLIDGLAVYRLSRLVTRDSLPLIAGPRERVQDRWPDRAVADLVVCPWCVSVWLAAGVLAARLLLPVPWSLLALVLAWSAVAGWLSEHE